MGTSRNYLSARRRVAEMLLDDAVFAARRIATANAAAATVTATSASSSSTATSSSPFTPSSEKSLADLVTQSRTEIAAFLAKVPKCWPMLPNVNWPDRAGIEKFAQALRDDPNHPANWHRRLVNEALAKPQAAMAYFQIRRSIWEWPEFASVRIGARTILEVVIELARDEAWPWYLAVPAEHVRRLARLTEGSYARSVRELECLAITRPARVARIARRDGTRMFPGQVDESESIKPIAQWVIRYRRGVPWNKKRAAWWINYDLLCGTDRVLPGFVVSLRTLSKTYQSRNTRMGRAPGNWVMPDGDADDAADAFRAMEEALTRSGPLPPAGLRAPLWRDWRWAPA